MLSYFIKSISELLIEKSLKWQSESLLRDLSLWNLNINNKNHIVVDGVDAIDLIKKYNSPLFVVNLKQLIKDARDIKCALSPAPIGSKILYSYKTNCIPGILKEIYNQGIGAEVISPYELWLAKELGIPGDAIVFNGVCKTEESIRLAIQMNILAINIDCLEEIDRIYRLAKELNKKVRVGIRLAMDPKDQFGFEIENDKALHACKKIASCSDYLDLEGLHFNFRSNEKKSSFHKKCAIKALKFICKLKETTDVKISYLNIGGGFGVPTTKIMTKLEYGMYRLFECLPKPPEPDDCQPIGQFLSDIIKCIKEFCLNHNIRMPSIIIEPGRYITSKSELLLTKVNSVKVRNDGTRFALTDVGRLSSTYPCGYEYHEIFVANRANDQFDQAYKIVGRVCTSADWLCKNRYLPILKKGDILAVMDAGAYFSSYSSNFAFPRPAIVMVANGNSHIIRKHETYKHLVAMDL